MDSSLTNEICNLLIKKKLLSESNLKKAKETLTKKGGELSDTLVKMNAVTRENLLSALSEATNLIPINLARVNVPDDVLKFIPKRVSMRYRVLPISRMGNSLTIAMVDPQNIFALDDLKATTGLEITPVIADTEDMGEALRKCYERTADEEISDIVEDMASGGMEMVTEKKEEISSGELLKIMEETPVIKLTNLIISQAVKERASDVFIEPMEKDFRVRYRIDGILYIRHNPPKKYHCAIISRLKVMSNLNIAERRLPQDGRFRLRIEDRRVDFRLSIIPSIVGEKASLRILDKERITIDIEKLGFTKKTQDTICTASGVPHGMIMVCGPTGCGKTTTLYSILKHVDAPGKNLVTVEDPVEYELKGINQVSVQSDIGLTFAGCLRSILRQDPDIVMIGEIRDFETVDIAIKAALTGHLVLSTLHTNTACGSVVRLVNMGVEPFLIASSVILIVAQRLTRKLCTSCREAYTPTNEVAKKYNLFDKDGKIATIYKPKGCKECMNSGYRGRGVIAECVRITPTVKELLFKHAQEAELEKTARREGMITLRQNGIEAVLAGETSLEEILHLTTESRKIEE